MGKLQVPGSGASPVQVEMSVGTKAERQNKVISPAFGAGSLSHFSAETSHAAEFDADTILVETDLGQQ